MMSSKAKLRNKAYLERQKKREQKKAIEERRSQIMKNGSMEEMAAVMGVRLK